MSREDSACKKKTFWRKRLFCRFSLGFSSAWDLAKVFRTLGRDLVVNLATIFQKDCQKCNLLVHRKILQKRNHLVKFIFLYIILSHWAKDIVILEQNFCWAVKTTFIVCSRKIWEKKLAKSTKLLLFLDFRQKDFEILGESTSAVLSKLPISWSDGTFAGKTIFPKTTTFTTYSGFEQKLSDTNRKSFGRFVNTTV